MINKSQYDDFLAAYQTNAASRDTREVAELPWNYIVIGLTFVDEGTAARLRGRGAGDLIVRHMPNQLGMPSVQPWHERFRDSGGGARSTTGRSRVRLDCEFHDNLSQKRLILDRAMGPGGEEVHLMLHC